MGYSWIWWWNRWSNIVFERCKEAHYQAGSERRYMGISQRGKFGDFNASNGWLSTFMESNNFYPDKLQISLLSQMINFCSAHWSIWSVFRHRSYNHTNELQSYWMIRLFMLKILEELPLLLLDKGTFCWRLGICFY